MDSLPVHISGDQLRTGASRSPVCWTSRKTRRSSQARWRRVRTRILQASAEITDTFVILLQLSSSTRVSSWGSPGRFSPGTCFFLLVTSPTRRHRASRPDGSLATITEVVHREKKKRRSNSWFASWQWTSLKPKQHPSFTIFVRLVLVSFGIFLENSVE